MLEPESFYAHKNAIAPMIVIFYHSEIDMEVLDVSIETVEFGNYRDMLEINGDANDVLAIT